MPPRKKKIVEPPVSGVVDDDTPVSDAAQKAISRLMTVVDTNKEVVIPPPTVTAPYKKPKRAPSEYNKFTTAYWAAHPELKELPFKEAAKQVVDAWNLQKASATE